MSMCKNFIKGDSGVLKYFNTQFTLKLYLANHSHLWVGVLVNQEVVHKHSIWGSVEFCFLGPYFLGAAASALS